MGHTKPEEERQVDDWKLGAGFSFEKLINMNWSLDQVPGYWSSYLKSDYMKTTCIAMEVYTSLVLGVWAGAFTYQILALLWSKMIETLLYIESKKPEISDWLNNN